LLQDVNFIEVFEMKNAEQIAGKAEEKSWEIAQRSAMTAEREAIQRQK
jgi:hypothetical protein